MLTKTHEQLKLSPKENIEFIVEPGLLAKTGIMVVAGEPGVGKSWLAMQAGFDIANGRRLWGLFPTRKRKTQHFELENRTQNERERFKSFPGEEENVGYCDDIEPTFDNIQFNLFRDEIKKFGAEVCIIDSYAATIDDDNDLRSQKKTLKWYRHIANEFGVAIILVQHINKRGRAYDNKDRKFITPPIVLDDIRGSKVFEYGIDTALGLSKNSHTNKYIQFLKTRYCKYPVTDIKIELVFNPGTDFVYAPKDIMFIEILKLLDKEGLCSLQFLEKTLGISRHTLLNAAEQLRCLGLIKEETIYPNKFLEAINIPNRLCLSDLNPEN